jgi:hypothetical protein
MTRDEILNMPAGKIMDDLIRIKIFEYARMHYPGEDYWGEKCEDKDFPSCLCLRQVPYHNYSKDMSAAWEVVERIADSNFSLARNGDLCPSGLWECIVTGAVANANTAPLAICRAALLAVLENGND